MSSFFLMSIDNIDLQLDNSYRLGNRLKVYEADIEVARSVIFPLLYELHPIESSFIFLYIFKGKTQEEIATLYGVTQGAVSGRLRRAMTRLKFIYSLPRINEGAMPFILREFIDNQLWVQVMLLMFDSTSHAVVARLLDISQGGARQAFLSSLEILVASKKHLIDAPEDFLPSQSLLEFYTLVRCESNGAPITAREINGWVLEQLSMLVEIYDKISQNYSIKSREKSSIPRHHLVDLALDLRTQ